MKELQELLLESTKTKKWDIAKLHSILYRHHIELTEGCPLKPSVTIGSFLIQQDDAPLSAWVKKHPRFKNADASAQELVAPRLTANRPNHFESLSSINDLFNLLCTDYLSVREISFLLMARKSHYEMRKATLVKKLRHFYFYISNGQINESDLSTLDLENIILPLLRLSKKNISELYSDLMAFIISEKNQSIVNDTVWLLILYKLIEAMGFPADELHKLSKQDLLFGHSTYKEATNQLFAYLRSIAQLAMPTPLNGAVQTFLQRAKKYSQYARLPWGYPIGHPKPRDFDQTRQEVEHLVGRKDISEDTMNNLVAMLASYPTLAPRALSALGKFYSPLINFQLVNFEYSKSPYFHFIQFLGKVERYIDRPDAITKDLKKEQIKHILFPDGVTSLFDTHPPQRFLFGLARLGLEGWLTREERLQLVNVAKSPRWNSKTITDFHYSPFRRFIILIKKRAMLPNLDYGLWFSFLIENNLAVTFQWDTSLAYLFACTNFLTEYQKFKSGEASAPKVTNEEKRLIEKISMPNILQKANALMEIFLPRQVQVQYRTWLFLLSLAHAFNPKRPGGFLTLNDIPKNKAQALRIAAAVSKQRIPDETPLHVIKQYFSAFDSVKKCVGLNAHDFYDLVLPKITFDDPWLNHISGIWPLIVKTDPAILQLLQQDDAFSKRLGYLLTKYGNEFIFSLLRSKFAAESDGQLSASTLRRVIGLPESAFKELETAVDRTAHSSVTSQQFVESVEKFINSHPVLLAILDPKRASNEKRRLVAESHVVHLIFLTLGKYSIEKMNRLSQIIIDRKKNINTIVYVINYCSRVYRIHEPYTQPACLVLILDCIEKFANEKLFAERFAEFTKILSSAQLASLPRIPKIVKDFQDDYDRCMMDEELLDLMDLSSPDTELPEADARARPPATPPPFVFFVPSGAPPPQGSKRAREEESDDEDHPPPTKRANLSA